MSDRPGYFLPYRYAAATRACDYPALLPIFERASTRFCDLMRRIDTYRDAYARFGGPPPAPRFSQDWFPRLDACAAYTIVRERRPSTIFEVGCGHSTRMMARAVADGQLSTRHICIDPAPRAKLEGLRLEHRSMTLDQVDPTEIAELIDDDILFIDSSHIAVPGSDVDRLVNDVLPRLQEGVLVHFHDIFLPHAYPDQWAWRGYNEQSLVAALLAGCTYELLFSSAYTLRYLPDVIRKSCVAGLPRLNGAIESSLWLRKVGSL